MCSVRHQATLQSSPILLSYEKFVRDSIPKKGQVLAYRKLASSSDRRRSAHFYTVVHIRDWNDLPESLMSSAELSDDSVSKFTSLVRARD